MAKDDGAPKVAASELTISPRERSLTVSTAQGTNPPSPRQPNSQSLRQDRISVGSRINKIVVTRPPYAANDDLDFERTVGSPAVGQFAGTHDHDRSLRGRHPGVQPSAHAKSPTLPSTNNAVGDTTPSQVSSSTATAVDDNAQPAKHSEKAAEGDRDGVSADNEKVKVKQDPNDPQLPNSILRPHIARMASNDASRWLAFTLPTQYRKRFDEYMAQRAKEQEERRARELAEGSSDSSDSSTNSRASIDEHSDDGDYFSQPSNHDHKHYHHRHHRHRGGRSHKRRRTEEVVSRVRRGADDLTKKPKRGSRKSSMNQPRQTSHGDEEGGPQHLYAPGVISTHQAHTPGWNSPWQPRQTSRYDHSFPLGMEGLPVSHTQTTKRKKGRLELFQRWLVRSAFAPLFLRLFNLAFSTSTLAIAIEIRLESRQANVAGVMGSSGIFAMVIAPLSLVHIFTNVYAEYFGSPIGVWKVRSKMYYALLELLFISLWSALLALSFDDLFTSVAGCSSYTPNAQYNAMALGANGPKGNVATTLCTYQSAQISVVFCGLILYVMVLIVSLFRIFAKINRYTNDRSKA